MKQIIDHLLLLFDATIRHPPDDIVREVLTTAQQRVLVLHDRRRRLDKPFVVAIVGLSNVGKSTLMNSLLGDELAPVGNYPCTACPVEFSFGKQFELTVVPTGDYRRPHWACVDASELLARLMAIADEKRRTYDGRVSRVEIKASLPILENGLVLADTPGFNAVQLESTDGTHQRSLEDYLRTRASQVFWVVRATFGIEKAEKGFFDRFLGAICDDIIVTGAESLNEDQRRRWRRRVAAHLPGYTPRFHFVSMVEGAAASQSSERGRCERAGMIELETRLRELSIAGARIAVLQQAVEELAREFGNWARMHWSSTTGPSRHFWSPPEWAKLKLSAANDSLAQTIVSQLDLPEHC